MKRLIFTPVIVFLCFLFIVIVFPPGLAADNRAAEQAVQLLPEDLQVRAAVLLDYETGSVLFDKNGDYPIPPASLTKLMTMHLVQQEIEAGRLRLNQVVDVPEEAYWKNLPADSSLMFLEPGQRVTVRELLLGLTVSSGNDAAIAAAILVSGSVDAFVERMNREAADLGLPMVRFFDASGLDPRNCVTAGQFARFCRYYIAAHPSAMDFFHSAEVFSYPTSANLPGSMFVTSVTTKNRNLLVHSYEGVDGLKSGFIEESGYNVALTAVRGGMRLVAVLLGGSGENHTVGKERLAADGRNVLDYGFDNFVHLVPRGIDYGMLKVWKGRQNDVSVLPAEEILVCVRQDEAKEIEYTVDLPGHLVAPVPAGVPVGSLTVTLRGETLASAFLVPEGDIPLAGPVKRLLHAVAMRLKGVEK